jgi:hypothetical protein
VVVGERPLRPQGIVPAADQTRYTQLAARLWSTCETAAEKRASVGPGTLFCQAGARPALAAVGIAPDFEATSPAIDFVHRRTADAEIYFVRNDQPETVTADLTFRVRNLQPEIFDPVTGNVTRVMDFESTADGRTRLWFAFAPHEAFFVVLRRPAARVHPVAILKNGHALPLSASTMLDEERGAMTLRTSAPGEYSVKFSDGRESRLTVSAATESALSGGWTLSFPPNWGAPAKVDVPELKSWTDFADSGVRYFSGTATYRISLHIGADQLVPGRELWLDLGDVREVAQIRVNGTALTPLWKQPYSARIDTLLHRGENTLEVEVTNLWPNRLIGDAQPGAAHRYTWTNIKKYSSSSPLLPSGLLGPVRLVPVFTVPVLAPATAGGR